MDPETRLGLFLLCSLLLDGRRRRDTNSIMLLVQFYVVILASGFATLSVLLAGVPGVKEAASGDGAPRSHDVNIVNWGLGQRNPLGMLYSDSSNPDLQ